MASSPRPRPTLPLEILEQIVELHGEADAQQWEGDFSAQTSRRHHSNAILACHMVSKQFRACALRVICRKTFIDLYDTPERLERLQDVIFGESHHLSQLERPLRFIKEIVIFLTNSNRAGSPMHKEVVVPGLKAIADKVPIGNLSLYANPMPRTRIYWLNIELDVLHALEAIIQLPSLVSLYMRDVGGLLRQNFRLNTHLHTLSLLRSNYMRSPRSFAAVLPKLEKLFIHHCRQFPDGLQLPKVRTISARHLYLSESDASFKVIQRSAKTLTKLTVHDTEGKLLFLSMRVN